jgi:hypothetical protein
VTGLAAVAEMRLPVDPRNAYEGSFLPLGIAALVVPFLLAGLAFDGFFVGDSGVKLISAQNVISHPSRPFEVDLPRIDDVAAGDYMDPFFRQHGDHAHAVTSPLFPLLTAPFIGLFGLEGAYILPVASFLLLIPATAALARHSGTAAPGISGLALAMCSPMLFYGLEYWEHAPAVLLATAAAALALEARQRPSTFALAGLAMAFAIQLRPEAAWSALALVLALLALRSRGLSVPIFVASAMVGLLPYALYNQAHFGTPLGLHVTSNLVAFDASWLTSRGVFAQSWFFGISQRESLWAAFPFSLLVLVSPRVNRRGVALWLLILVPLLGVLATAPNDGGGQWGPRYLMIIVPPLVVLAVDAAGRFRIRAKKSAGFRFLATAVIVLFAVAGLLSTRSAYRELRGSKRIHAEVARTAASLGERYVVTNAWWLDQMAAVNYPEHTFLYVPDTNALDDLLRLFGEQHVTSFALIHSNEEPMWDLESVVSSGYKQVHLRRQDVRLLEYRIFDRD